MKIWHLDSDGEKFDNLGFANDFTVEFMQSFNGSSKVENWEPFEISYAPIRKNENRKGFANINNVNALVNLPVMDQKAIDILGDFMQGSAEILPLIFTEKEFFLINIIEILDCVDLDKSEYEQLDSGKILYFTKYSLKEDVLKGKHIFKTTARRMDNPYVSDEFRQRVLDSDLKGFVFNEVWDSSTV